jgi:tetratricopeptide (TPR) repeat protein
VAGAGRLGSKGKACSQCYSRGQTAGVDSRHGSNLDPQLRAASSSGKLRFDEGGLVSMSFRLYKSVRLGKGVRLNLSKTGIGISAGVPGARYSVHSSGRTTRTIGAPGTGIYYRKDTHSKGGHPSRGRTTPGPTTVAPVYPKAGLLAPKAEKLFVQGVTAYMEGRHGDALEAFEDVEAKDVNEQHIGEEFFAGMCLVGLDRLEEAVFYLETVLASEFSIPDPLMTKYGIGGLIEIGVTPAVPVTVPMNNLAVALLLAEVYQRTDQRQKAIELLESLGAEAPGEPVFALSLADLYSEGAEWDDVVRVTQGVQANEDDVSLNILSLRASSLSELGMSEAALALTKECLRTKKRSPELLRFARYVRGRAYERAGKESMARKEYEKVYAEETSYLDVAERLGRQSPQPPALATPPRPD